MTQINYAYRGTDDDVPAVGTDDYDLWLATINRKKSEWAGDTKHTWDSMFEIRSITPVLAGTQSYDLDDDFTSPSDTIIVTSGGKDYEYTVVKPQERESGKQQVYISGNAPKVLNFVDTIEATNPIVGGTIKVAGYYEPADVTGDSDDILVDDPYWIVYSVASELAFNDLTYESKTPALNAKANAVYAGMVSNNNRGTSTYPRRVRTNVNRIPGVR
jgi:hypothetical protein